MKSSFVIGVDFGTDSVRAILVDASNGHEIASSVFGYPRYKEGLFCNASQQQFRQHPLDYIEGLEYTIKAILKEAGSTAASLVKAISVDTTGSTPVAVDEKGQPLALQPSFKDNPNAMFVLWKDHTAVEEAAAINAHAATYKPNYLQFVGGVYSSEWFWAKLLSVLKKDEQVRLACYSFVEHCDWIPFLLTGGQQARDLKRSVCAAGHKALWSYCWNGLPPDDFFSSLHPLLAGFTERLFTTTYTADQPAGFLSQEWAQKLGLSTDVVVGIGAFDAHMGAVGGQIEPYFLSKVMGTSTCDMLVAPTDEVQDKLVKGICGQVPGSVIPGMIGMEAGQSAFGDAYAWFKHLLQWPLQQVISHQALAENSDFKKVVEQAADQIIPELSRQAALLPFSEKDEMAVDWFNGRRTPDANALVKGAVFGLTLGSDAPRVFRAIVEATCFGAKAIVDRFVEQQVPIKGVIGMGGIAKKSPYIMQMMADVLNMPIRIHQSEQTCALGAAMFAATAAGMYNKVEDAMQAMGQGFSEIYEPNWEKASLYNQRYKLYKKAGEFMEQQTARAFDSHN